MVSDEKFHWAIKFLMNRAMDLLLEAGAMKIVLEHQFPGYQQRVEEVRQELAERPEVLEFRELTELFEIEEALQAFAKYDGPPH